jgi:hypothetical protein
MRCDVACASDLVHHTIFRFPLQSLSAVDLYASAQPIDAAHTGFHHHSLAQLAGRSIDFECVGFHACRCRTETHTLHELNENEHVSEALATVAPEASFFRTDDKAGVAIVMTR